ncbi:CoA transferase [Novosphingobium panipatense]
MKPLEGIRIADFTVHNAGPFCTHLLSQLGAEVIKVESAMRPDAFRKPHPVYGREGPATFDQVASNKLSVRMNLKKPEGVALARRLVAASDVAAESFRPGVMARLGLGYDALKSVREDIVLLSISSSGQSGPDAYFAGYAPLLAPGADWVN